MILILTQCFPPRRGGIETLMGSLARELAAAGRQVLVLADAAPGAAGIDGAVGHAVRRFGGLKPLRRYLKGRAATRLAAGAEVVYADSWKSLEYLSPGGAAPVLCFAHGNEYPAHPAEAKAARIARSLERATALLAVSADTAARAAPFVPARLAVILRSPPVDRPPEPSPADLERCRELWAGAGGPRLVTVARLEPIKGVDRVIAALPALLPLHPDLRYVVGGDGPDRPRLERLAAASGVAGRVHFAGWVDAAARTALFRTADLYVQPTRAEGDRREGYGLVFVEAALQGLPALGGRGCGAASAVRDGDTGRLCDGGDQDDVTAALGRLLADRPALRAMGERARRAAGTQLWSVRLPEFLADAAMPGPRPADRSPA